MRTDLFTNNFRVPHEKGARKKWSDSLQSNGFKLIEGNLDFICWLHFSAGDIKLTKTRKPKYTLEEGAIPLPVEIPEAE